MLSAEAFRDNEFRGVNDGDRALSSVSMNRRFESDHRPRGLVIKNGAQLFAGDVATA
jgi:hypothetical protein